MKAIVLLTYCLSFSLPVFGEPNCDIKEIIFQNAKDSSLSIYLTEKPFKKYKKMPFEGIDLDISRDGKRIAFTSHYGGGKNEGKDRTIKVFERETNNIMTFESLADKTSYNAKLSPQGDKIVFSTLVKNTENSGWGIAILYLQTKEWSMLVSKEGEPYIGVYYQPSWAPDGKSIIFHDLKNIYEVDIDGTLKRKISVTQLGKYLDSTDTVQINKDRTKLLFTAKLGKPFFQKAVFIYNLENGNIIQISSKNMAANDPLWGPDEKTIIFGGETFPPRNGGIYLISEDGKEYKAFNPGYLCIFIRIFL